MAAPGRQLQDLPPELLLLILGYIRRPSALKSLCLTSKCLRSLAIPLLYNKITLDASNSISTANTAFLNASNGHAFVKDLSFEPLVAAIKDQASALHFVKRAIRVVPLNGLKCLSLPSDLVADGILMMQIATSQKNLVELDWPIVGSHLTDTMSSPLPQPWVASLRSIILAEAIGSVKDLVGYNKVLREVKQLSSLRIGSNRLADERTSSTGSTLHPDLFAKTLFRHIAPFGSEGPLKIATVNFTGTDLGNFEQIYLRVIDWRVVRNLGLWSCRGMHAFLDGLASQCEEIPGSLRSVECTTHETTSPHQLDRFLRQCVGAIEFILSYPADSADAVPVPAAAIMTPIVATLEHLTLEIFVQSPFSPRISDLVTLSADYVQALVDSGKQLREVALSFPQCSVTSDMWERENPWRRQMEALATLPRLLAIRVLNWPAAPDRIFEKGTMTTDNRVEHELMWHRYSALLDTFATRALRCVHIVRQSLGLRPLRVLCIGSRSAFVEVPFEDGRRGFPGEIRSYVPAWQSSLGGEDALFAREVSGSDVCYDDQHYQAVMYV